MNKDWMIKRLNKIKFNKPVLVEGLPGIGNVGKIAVDFIIESLNAQKVFEISSYSFANCVFVNEEGISELPKIEVFHKKRKGGDLFLVSGDIQPIDVRGCYEFCDNLLNLFQENGGKEIITLGGMGMNNAPKKAKVYCAGTSKKIINSYKVDGVKTSGGIVGPIIGVSGLLLGLAKDRGLNGVTMLVETYGHPSYLGIKEARELLKVLNTKLKLGLNMNDLDKEVKMIEEEIRDKIEKLTDIDKGNKLGFMKNKKKIVDTANYFG